MLRVSSDRDKRPHQSSRKKMIDTFKCCFIAGLSALHPKFSLRLWCGLLSRSEDTLNMYRQSQQHPHMSAYTPKNGVFHYNTKPMAQQGIRTLVYKTPKQRDTWAQHSVDAWYIGYASNHYRCHCCYTPGTRYEQIAYTVSFS